MITFNFCLNSLLILQYSGLEQDPKQELYEISISAAADRPAWHKGSAHANQTISSTWPSCWIQMSMVGVINCCDDWRLSRVYDTHQQTTLTVPETINCARNAKNRHLNLPHLYLAPPLVVTPLEFRLDFWHLKTEVPGLSYDVVCMILGLAILVEHRLVTHRRTDGRTDTRWQQVPP